MRDFSNNSRWEWHARHVWNAGVVQYKVQCWLIRMECSQRSAAYHYRVSSLSISLLMSVLNILWVT